MNFVGFITPVVERQLIHINRLMAGSTLLVLPRVVLDRTTAQIKVVRKSLGGQLIINCHDLYIATSTDFTYQQSTIVSNSGKITIDLTLTHGLKNTKVVTKDLTLMKARHKVIEILIEQESSFKPNP